MVSTVATQEQEEAVSTVLRKKSHDNMTTPTKNTTITTTTKKTAKTAVKKRLDVADNGDGPWRRLMRHAQKRRSLSAPPTTGRRRRILEDHFRVDPVQKVVLPGVPKHDDDWARDSHDFFNLVVLIPVSVLNSMNWDWDIIIKLLRKNVPALLASSAATNNSKHTNNLTISDAWTGEWFDLFFGITALYFVLDLLWILIIPQCVKSPATITQHHIATMLYIIIPYYVEDYRWCMGACMSVEINTWFLIARRVFNKQGFPPWIIDLSYISFRVKLISILFYLTWIAIRCILYPYLTLPFYNNWMNYSQQVGTKWNVVAIALPLHLSFCILNIKWSYDLLMSKIRYWRRRGQYKEYISKGL